MIGKVLAVFGFVAVASAADLTVGIEGGRLIFDQNITASPAIWKQVKLLTVNAANGTEELISRIVVIDNRPEKDGEAKVLEGGEGQTNVTLELKSPAVFRGFDFSIQVFANEPNVYGRATQQTQVPAQFPNHPATTGSDTQNPQVLKDLDVNSNRKPQDGGDIIIEAPAPTASSTTEENKDDQQKINPALVGKDQPRLNRDTEEHKIKYQTTVPTPVEVDGTKDAKVNENATTALPEIDGSLKTALDSVFENNSTQKTEEEDTQKVPVMPQAESDDLINFRDDEENRKVRQAYKDPVVPAVPTELSNGDHTTVTTPKSELSSTTQKVGEEKTATEVSVTTEKNVRQERYAPRIVPVTEEVPSTTQVSEATTEIVQTTQEDHVKGHHYIGHHYAQPLPYLK